MNRHHLPTRIAPSLALVALLLGVIMLAGCDSDTAAPAAPSAQAPALPDPEGLRVDLAFFDQTAEALALTDKSADDAAKFGRQNFYNAYLRAVIVSAMTELVLTPPVTAFSLALHTPPSHQPDGSWLWVYTFVDGAEEAQVRLRGEVIGDEVDWQMRVSLTDAHHDLDQALWFDGRTHGDGADGRWTFYDLDQAAAPACAELEWHHAATGHELRLRALLGDDAGDELTFSVQGDDHRIDYTTTEAPAAWFVRWDATDGSGGLRVPDYNGGDEACWDAQQYDVDCAR